MIYPDDPEGIYECPVTSSQMTWLRWWSDVWELRIDPAPSDVGTLEVVFTRGQVYRYDHVPARVYLDLVTESAAVVGNLASDDGSGRAPPDPARSVGRLFDRLVKQGGYAYRRVVPS